MSAQLTDLVVGIAAITTAALLTLGIADAIDKDTRDRATDIGVGGAIVEAVGAVTFVTGAIVWGAGSARNRRLARTNAEHQPSIRLTPTRRGLSAGLSLRF